jgi:hypothetical protein
MGISLKEFQDVGDKNDLFAGTAGMNNGNMLIGIDAAGSECDIAEMSCVQAFFGCEDEDDIPFFKEIGVKGDLFHGDIGSFSGTQCGLNFFNGMKHLFISEFGVGFPVRGHEVDFLFPDC